MLWTYSSVSFACGNAVILAFTISPGDGVMRSCKSSKRSYFRLCVWRGYLTNSAPERRTQVLRASPTYDFVMAGIVVSLSC
jgi:hypothetical protein